jgi:hypothetical protein
MGRAPRAEGDDAGPAPAEHLSGHIAAALRPTEAQRRYLERGLTQPGGKLPLFDRDGREVPKKTIESCVARGWAEPWGRNPIKPDWSVCRLTEAGFRVLGHDPPAKTAPSGRTRVIARANPRASGD